MKTTSFILTNRSLCMDCSFALRRFIGGLEGVDSIDVGEGKVMVSFDEKRIAQERLREIAKDSIRKLGYDLEE